MTPDRHLRCAEEEMTRIKRKKEKGKLRGRNYGFIPLKRKYLNQGKREKYFSKWFMFK